MNARVRIGGARPVYIDGSRHDTVQAAYTSAITRGLDISEPAFTKRLKASGDNPTWAELLKPVSKARQAAGVRSGLAATTRAQHERSLMADLCAELDARKVAIGAKGVA